jgi:hypothetical protein
LSIVDGLLPKYPFRCLKTFWINPRLASGDYKNSPAAQTIVIADLALCQDLLAKTLSMVASTDIIWATGRKDVTRFFPGYFI